MQPDQMQDTEITPEEAKASLGLATRLSEQQLMQMHPPMEEPTTETEQPETPEPNEVDIEAKLEEMKKEIEATFDSRLKDEIQKLRDDIQEAISEDDSEEEDGE